MQFLQFYQRNRSKGCKDGLRNLSGRNPAPEYLATRIITHRRKTQAHLFTRKTLSALGETYKVLIIKLKAS